LLGRLLHRKQQHDPLLLLMQRSGDIGESVDIERVKYFFNEQKVSTITGSFMEQLVADILVDANFESFPIPYEQEQNKQIPRVKLEIPLRLWSNRTDSALGEFDALVIGPPGATKKLTQLCPIHCINDDKLLDPSTSTILLAEVKATAGTLISKIEEAEKKGKIYYILQDTSPVVHKALFLNGGQDSKNFILHGEFSTNEREKAVWHKLKAANVSLFYKQSFTQEWITDLTSMIERQKVHIERQDVHIARQEVNFEKAKADNERLRVDIDMQKADNERQKVQIAILMEMKKEFDEIKVAMKAQNEDKKQQG